jgi:hypothetical protein
MAPASLSYCPPLDQAVCGGLPQFRRFSAGIQTPTSGSLSCGSLLSLRTGVDRAPASYLGFQIRASNRSGTGSTLWRRNWPRTLAHRNQNPSAAHGAAFSGTWLPSTRPLCFGRIGCLGPCCLMARLSICSQRCRQYYSACQPWRVAHDERAFSFPATCGGPSRRTARANVGDAD